MIFDENYINGAIGVALGVLSFVVILEFGYWLAGLITAPAVTYVYVKIKNG